jgi:hypothetical protein
MKRVRFSNVVRDAIYVSPRDPEFDLSAEALRGEGYEYLHRLLPEAIVHASAARGEARCAYCHDGVQGSGADTVTCPRCRTVLHAVCWSELGRCPVMGCDGLGR